MLPYKSGSQNPKKTQIHKAKNIMAVSKSKALSNDKNYVAKSSKFPIQENTLRQVFQPLFSPKTLITKDELGKEISGTGLLIFQGYLHSTTDWTDTNGVMQSQPKFSFVFAVKGTDGLIKNIAVKTNYTYQSGNLLDRMLKNLSITGFISEKTLDDDDEFGTIKTLDDESIKTKLNDLRGLAFYGEFEYRTNSKGYSFYELKPETLKARLDKEGNHQRLQEAMATNPNASYVEIGE